MFCAFEGGYVLAGARAAFYEEGAAVVVGSFGGLRCAVAVAGVGLGHGVRWRGG